jgi:1-deoxy-D-xylulose-5-phosphate reductoisomerase
LPRKTNKRRGLIVLGSTGRIGRLCLELADRYEERLRVVGLSAGGNGALLAEQAIAHSPTAVALAKEEAAEDFARAVSGRWKGEILVGKEGAEQLAGWPDAEIVVNGIMGAAGLKPTLAALEAGRRVGLANKESLVVAGALVCRARDRCGGSIIPIDSEHSAIFQCLQGRSSNEVRALILTASGGPLLHLTAQELESVTPQRALQHPTWRMGKRITVDAATLFNKGMELIEAQWLFGLPLEQLRALIHPQSVVHGLVELCDGSLIAHLSNPDMRLPIQLALSYPERWEEGAQRCDLASFGSLTFEEPDTERFPCLRIVREAGRVGGTAPAVCNAADEVLVAGFLEGEIPFVAIAAGLDSVLVKHSAIQDPSLDQVLAADAWARQAAEAFLHDARALR